MVTEKNSSYRWIVLVAMMLGVSSLYYCVLLVPSVAVTIIDVFSFSQVQFASIASVAFLAGAILGLPSGALADRYGVKAIILIGLALSLIGAIGRIYSDSYGSFLLFSFLIGIGAAAIDANAAKYINMWFQEKEMGLAMGLFVSSSAVGTSMAFATGNRFSSYTTAFAAGAVWVAVAFAVWLFFAKNAKTQDGVKTEPIKKHIGISVKSKNLWISAVSIFLILGGVMVVNNFLTQALILEKGCEPVQAGMITTMLNVCLVIGGIGSGMITGKFGKVKPVIITICIVCGICYYLAWIVPFSAATYIILCIAGFAAGGTIPVTKTIVPLITKTGDFGPESIGTAGGIHSAAQNLGAFVVPTYIVAALVGQDFNMSFLMAFIIFTVAGLLNLFIPELGSGND